MLNSDFGSVYRNMQQSPQPDRPRFKLAYTITPGAPVLPRPAEQQLQSNVRSLPTPGDLVTTPAFSQIDRPVVTVGTGFDPSKTYKLNWTSLTGNRIIGHWEESSREVAQAKDISPDATTEPRIPETERPDESPAGLGKGVGVPPGTAGRETGQTPNN